MDPRRAARTRSSIDRSIDRALEFIAAEDTFWTAK